MMWGSKLFAGLLAMLLSACSGADVPGSVTAMMAAEFPAHGQVHVQSRGKIVIKPETAVCYLPGGFIVDPQQLFTALKQAKSTQSGSRLVPAESSEQCQRGSDAALMLGRESANRNGEPYKLVLAVWQGDPARGGAYWVGGIERNRPDWLKIEIVSFADEHPTPASIEARQINRLANDDISMLSKYFIDYLTDEGAPR